jgi:starch synthase
MVPGFDVLSVASEAYPLIKTGGLADVVGALPKALAPEGIGVKTLLPGYPSVLKQLGTAETVHRFDEFFGGPAQLLLGNGSGLDVIAIDAPHLYDRPGGPYSGPDGKDWPDNPQRFAALGKAAELLARGLVPRLTPRILHLHDWQSGLAAAYVRYGAGHRPGVITTVHNIAFQGQAPAYMLGMLGLPPEAYSVDGVEYYGAIGMLKAGLALADRITTVSPTYAREIATPEFGMGLDGLIRTRAAEVSGILNGIDTDVWNAADDPLIAAPFNASNLSGRAENRHALRARLGLHEAKDAPIFGVVSRLSWQKGLDLLLEALPLILTEGGQIALLGAGEAAIQDGFAAASRAHPGKVGCHFGYDEALAHLIQAGSDVIAVPSRFEPCGLTQLCALRYGALPLVARTGGLADSVIDANDMAIAAGVATGVQFSPVTREALEAAIRQTFRLWRSRTDWKRLQQNGMASDVSWTNPAKRYAALYREVMAERGQKPK